MTEHPEELQRQIVNLKTENERLRAVLDTVRFHLRRNDHITPPTADAATRQMIGAIDAALKPVT